MLGHCRYGPKKYLIYYLDIISAIRFLISYQPFAQHMAYILVQRYLIDNSDKLVVDEEDEQIYKEMHTADWW